ncbi:MAG: hypothetical protein A2144_02890 [Chloroflexi bacterium RBG_16_50_9]|nr:MAG: hypothetical protein A2144_02890 [Chloroflexi bacterium RBG_16_50_9]
MFEITIDTGGTFTDAVLIDKERKIGTAKVPTDKQHPEEGIMRCMALLSQERGLSEEELLANLDALVVSTTLATNTMLEGKGAKCGLICTRGFKDVFELGRTMARWDCYNIKVPPPSVLIPRHLRWGVEERTLYTGEILTPLNEDDVREAVNRAKEQNIEVPVVAFLHSYANTLNEEKAAEIIKKEFPDVVISSHIVRRWVEFDRLSAAAIAAYVKPEMKNFAAGLQKRLSDRNSRANLLFLTSVGGVAGTEMVGDNPALFVGSGPAGGVLMGQFLAELVGFENIIVTDMGGTSFDVSIIPERRIQTTTESIIGDYKNAVESLDVASIGAGGGSIIRIDDMGMLRVGPSSAGSNPGPACYGRGGQLPTVTDANVILGYIPGDYFLGGRMPIDAGLAEKALRDNVADPLGMDLVEAAYAVSSLVETNMANRIFTSAVERGYDPRDFTLIIAGGAGPVHGVNLAVKLDIKHLYIPKYASVFCALGIMVADYKHILTRFLGRREDEVNVDQIKAFYDSMEEEGLAILKREAISESAIKFIRGAEMRYYGQLHNIEVLLPETKTGADFTEQDRTALIKGFNDRHKTLYGWANPAYPVTFTTLKLQAIGVRLPFKPVEQPFSGQDASVALKRKRRAYFKELGGLVDTPCYDGHKLRHGNLVAGPAIIEEVNTTVVLPPEARLTVDVYGNYSVRR